MGMGTTRGVALGLMILATGCGHIKEFAPIRYSTAFPRIPNQQRLIAQPARQAAEKACTAVNLQQYAGMTARVEVTGVFPHSHAELLDYVATVIEGEAARAGVKVLPALDPRFAPRHVIVAHHGNGPPMLPVSAPPADVRLVASVDWGGIDLKDQQYVTGWPLAGQVTLGALSLIGGVASTIGVLVDGNSGKLGMTIGIPLAGLGGAIAWAILDPSVGHVFTMQGRARVTLVGMPQSAGLAAAGGSGEGESSVVVDPESDTGFSLMIDLPQEPTEAYRRQAM